MLGQAEGPVLGCNPVTQGCVMRALLQRSLALAAALSAFACEAEGPTSVSSPSSHPPSSIPAQQHAPKLRTAADSAAFLRARGPRPKVSPIELAVSPQFGVPGYCFAGAGTGVGAPITTCPGDTVVVTITSAECSGVGDIMQVGGTVSMIVSSDACTGVGATQTGIASTAGNLTFALTDPRFGSGSWRVSGTYPDLIVQMEDGFGDGDYDDNVLSVHLGRRPCPPTGHPILDNAMNREKFDSSFQASNPRGPQTQRKEHIRAGYKFPDGHVESIDLNPPSATNCDIPTLFLPLTNGAGKLAWFWHSHPFAPGEIVAQCGNVILSPPVSGGAKSTRLGLPGQG